MVDHGRIIAEGSPRDLKARLGQTVVAITFADDATAERALGLLAGLSSNAPHLEPRAVELTTDHGPRTTAEALRLLDAAGLEVAGIVLREPSLDDVFLSLTGQRTEHEDPDAATTATATRRGRP